jgi:hypothetical protein
MMKKEQIIYFLLIILSLIMLSVGVSIITFDIMNNNLQKGDNVKESIEKNNFPNSQNINNNEKLPQNNYLK